MARLISLIVFLFSTIALASGGGMGAGGGGDKPGARVDTAWGPESGTDVSTFWREEAEREAQMDRNDPNWRNHFPHPSPTPTTYRGCYTEYYTLRAAQHDCPPGAIAVKFHTNQWTCDCNTDTSTTSTGGNY
jgi:hypothetical protein